MYLTMYILLKRRGDFLFMQISRLSSFIWIYTVVQKMEKSNNN